MGGYGVLPEEEGLGAPDAPVVGHFVTPVVALFVPFGEDGGDPDGAAGVVAVGDGDDASGEGFGAVVLPQGGARHFRFGDVGLLQQVFFEAVAGAVADAGFFRFFGADAQLGQGSQGRIVGVDQFVVVVGGARQQGAVDPGVAFFASGRLAVVRGERGTVGGDGGAVVVFEEDMGVFGVDAPGDGGEG